MRWRRKHFTLGSQVPGVVACGSLSCAAGRQRAACELLHERPHAECFQEKNPMLAPSGPHDPFIQSWWVWVSVSSLAHCRARLESRYYRRTENPFTNPDRSGACARACESTARQRGDELHARAPEQLALEKRLCVPTCRAALSATHGGWPAHIRKPSLIIHFPPAP